MSEELRITEDGETRITEDGESRILEGGDSDMTMKISSHLTGDSVLTYPIKSIAIKTNKNGRPNSV